MQSLICAFLSWRHDSWAQSTIMGTEYKNTWELYFFTVSEISSIIKMYKETENNKEHTSLDKIMSKNNRLK